MWAGRGAAVGVVTEGVDVEATLSVGVVAGEVPADGGRVGLGSLLESDGAGDLGVTSENSDCSTQSRVVSTPSPSSGKKQQNEQNDGGKREGAVRKAGEKPGFHVGL